VSAASQFQQPIPQCELNRDALAVLDAVLAWNDTDGHLLNGAIDPSAVFGGGHSLGGRTWLGLTSDVTECGLPREDRFAGFVLKDPTREALTLAQIEGNHVPTLLSSQYCRTLQFDLHEHLGSEPTMLMLEGYTPLSGGVTPPPDPGVNHALFAQTCQQVFANDFGGVTDFRAAVPPFRRSYCDDSAGTLRPEDDDARYAALERFFAAQNSRYGIAWVRLQTGQPQYATLFQPWHADDPGVAIVPPRSSRRHPLVPDRCP
jgi:hypothetical protein